MVLVLLCWNGRTIFVYLSSGDTWCPCHNTQGYTDLMSLVSLQLRLETTTTKEVACLLTSLGREHLSATRHLLQKGEHTAFLHGPDGFDCTLGKSSSLTSAQPVFSVNSVLRENFSFPKVRLGDDKQEQQSEMPISSPFGEVQW